MGYFLVAKTINILKVLALGYFDKFALKCTSDAGKVTNYIQIFHRG